ncbi:MAG: efflux pump, inner rane subunit [Acidobacteriaceae bacterium]|jgi:putative ABC transport system permease protein|nr:efflux pump, inner rane subunit [Acidobacteriaceae bacterium]
MSPTATAPEILRPKLALGEIINFAYDTFCSNKVRFALTGLGMVIGTASLILVVTIGMTGKQYVLNLIQGIGANLIYAEYEGGAQRISNAAPDPLTLNDLKAAQQAVPAIVAASPVVSLSDRISIGGGKERDVLVLGVFPEYRTVRNLVVLSGRFFDVQDEQAHNKVGVITQKMAEQLYGSTEAAVGKVIKLSGLPFTVIGTFKERVDTFGQSEVIDNTMAIPYTVSRYFTDTPNVKQIYFSVSDPSLVVPATEQIRRVIQSRHRAESVYNVTNLTELVSVADKTANALTVVLFLVAAVVLLVSGIGIMNIMLATVSARIREIGIRKALGATNREIRFQFLSEAVLISVGGGLIGVIIGLAIPYSVRFLTEYRIPISGLSAIVAIAVSSLVGILFGTIPAARAAKLDPVESLRYE